VRSAYWALTSVPGSGNGTQFYSELHKVALKGMGYGAEHPTTSGEINLLDALLADGASLRTAVDAGANVGAWSNAVAYRWPQATVHAFEPSDTVHERLVSRCAGQNIHCVRAALSDVSRTAVLNHVPGLTGMSSLHVRDLAEHGLAMTTSESVLCVTLDEYASEKGRGLAHVDFLKIDVEGHDFAVLQGATTLLDASRVSLIQFEFGGSNIDSRTFLRDFVRLLEPRYDLYHVLLNGIVPLHYSERQEIFVTRNFLALRRGPLPNIPANALAGYGRELR
jgi:FkbM family methyltransferase